MQLQRVAKIYLTVTLLLILSACATFPKLHPHVISIKNGKCGEYEVIQQADACHIVYKFKQWKPIDQCEGFFALPASDVNALTEYQAKQCANNQNPNPAP